MTSFTVKSRGCIKGTLYIIQILCRRYTFWSYPAGLTIADPPGKQKLKYRRVYSHHFHTTFTPLSPSLFTPHTIIYRAPLNCVSGFGYLHSIPRVCACTVCYFCLLTCILSNLGMCVHFCHFASGVDIPYAYVTVPQPTASRQHRRLPWTPCNRLQTSNAVS